MEATELRRLPVIDRANKMGRTFYKELAQARQQGKKVAWIGGYPTPIPILTAMDIAYCYADSYAATASARHMEKLLYSVAEARGYPPETCGYGMNMLGCTYLPEEEKKPEADPLYLVSEPDMVITIDPGCGIPAFYMEGARQRFKVPGFIFAQRYLWRKEDEEEVIQEVTEQFRRFITFIEDVLHTPFNWARLRQIMVTIKKATILRMEAADLAGRAIPSPTTVFDWGAALGIIMFGCGTPLSVEAYQQLKDEIKAAIAKHEGAVKNERVRLLWLGMMCWPHIGGLSRTFAKLGANIMAAMYTHRTFIHRPDRIDPEKPLESLAANCINSLSYNIDQYAEETIDMCRDYSIDGIVVHHPRTCYPFSPYYYDVMDIVSRRLGIPAICIEGDQCNADYLSPVRVQAQAETLVESILARKKR